VVAEELGVELLPLVSNFGQRVFFFDEAATVGAHQEALCRPECHDPGHGCGETRHKASSATAPPEQHSRFGRYHMEDHRIQLVSGTK